MREGNYAKARAIIEEGLKAKPDDPPLLYTLACAEARDGARDEALEHLREAVIAMPSLRENAREDEDFDSIRDDPRFPT
jgi:predicted Zn-dependent protease